MFARYMGCVKSQFFRGFSSLVGKSGPGTRRPTRVFAAAGLHEYASVPRVWGACGWVELPPRVLEQWPHGHLIDSP